MTRSAPPLSLAVVTASVRDGRLGPTPAEWFTRQARARTELDVHTVDLLAHPCPWCFPHRARNRPPTWSRTGTRCVRHSPGRTPSSW